MIRVSADSFAAFRSPPPCRSSAPTAAFAALVLVLPASFARAAVEPPSPRVDGAELVWPAIDAISINVHRGDGGYVTTLPGTATCWTAPSAGDWPLFDID